MTTSFTLNNSNNNTDNNENDNSPSGLWLQMQSRISQWLSTRQELIILFCSVDGRRNEDPNNNGIHKKLNYLCQVLIDYVTSGHFDIYVKLVQGSESLGEIDPEFKEQQKQIVRLAMPLIDESTEIALAFNDKYADALVDTEDMPALSKELNDLGLIMVKRFDVEDDLIEAFHTAYKATVETAEAE